MDEPFEEVTEESIVPPPPLAAQEDVSLWVLTGPVAGRYLKVPRQGGVLGRDPGIELSIPDLSVSRRHAELVRSVPTDLEIVDLGSRYGLYVEGARVARARLSEGDRVQLSGETVLRVRFQDPKESDVLERLHESVSRDALCGVAHRRTFLERFDGELAFARRHGTPLTVMILDVDRFRQVNAAYGQAAGDQILRSLARALSDAVRAEDIVARFGGDEFAVLLRGYAEPEAARLGERLLRTIRRRVVRSGDFKLRVTASIGIASLEGAQTENPSQLFAWAESALYVAKREGRDRMRLWSTTELKKRFST